MRHNRVITMSEQDTSVQDGDGVEQQATALRRWPDEERRVFVERYPGGDMQIEIGGMDAETLYLFSGEAESLRKMLDKLEEANGE